MANIPVVEFVELTNQHKTVKVMCIMTSASFFDDGFTGVHYRNYDVATNQLVGAGQSRGTDGIGAGSMITATALAKRSAKRYIERRFGGAT